MEDNYRKRMTLGQDGNALVQLVVVNAVLFAILKFIAVIYTLNTIQPDHFQTNVLSWFTLPANFDKLTSRPWTILTYMFSDPLVFRFIGNMFWLWGFGYILRWPTPFCPGSRLTHPLPSWPAPMPPSWP